ncbi:MAG TPA: hypothetical protein VKA46_28005 [Gemmataceae bacterium]|nr:hypothetical protein [Gemmataceae bacterium]
MPAALPPEIVVTEAADGVHYRLPRLQLGPVRFAGCILIAIGCVPAGMGGAFIAFAATVIPNLPWPVILVACLTLLVPLAFLLVGLALIFFGGWMLAGHQEISLSARHIRSALCVGPVRWSGRRSRARLKQFTVVRGNQPGPNAGTALGPSGNVLQAECEGSRPLRLARGYPEEWLQALADDLARNCRVLSAEAPDERATAVVGVSEESASPHDIRDRPERPVNCRAILKEEADGVTLVMPPAGVWRGTNTFIVLWTFLWCGMLLPLTVGLGTAALLGNVHDEQGQPISPLCPILFLVPFWLVGIPFLLGIVHRGRRRVTLTVDGKRLLVVQSGLFGTRRSEWSRQEIAELRVACDRRLRIGEGKQNPYYPWQIDLRIVPRDGAEVNVITYREGDPRKPDLEWMATVLRGALRLLDE